MHPILENKLNIDETEILRQGLEMQTRAYGVIDIPFLVDLIKSAHAKTVLDIGTGEGSFVLWLANELPETHFVAIDHNDDLLKLAKKNKADAIQNVEFHTAFFDETFEKKTYDLIFTRFTLEHSSSPEQFVSEAFKRLKPGGTLAIIDEYLFDTQIEAPTWQQFRCKILEAYKDFGVFPYVPMQVTTWLKSAGFVEPSVNIRAYSPNTIGGDLFKEMVLTLSVLLGKLYPDNWPLDFLKELDQFIDHAIKTNECDPYITMTHMTGRKPC
jgi:ubiquinone/menaquinone biosynthesis C-methylase UbiE